MSALRIGVVVAAVAAGPQLYALVAAGDLDTTTALLRWSAVVAACTLGVAGLRRIVADYEQQARVAAFVREQAHVERLLGTLPADPR